MNSHKSSSKARDSPVPRRAAPCGAMCRVGSAVRRRADAVCRVGTAVRRRAAPYCAVRRRVRRVCRVATRRAVWQGRAVWRAVRPAVRRFFPRISLRIS